MTSSRLIAWAIVAGVILGVVYSLSPLTVLFLASILPMWSWLVRDLPKHERRWLLALFVIAVVLRLSAVAGLFMTADPAIPYANFFGDEEFFKRRTIWLRNVSLGVPIHTADFLYAFDRTGDSGYLYVLAFVQALVGAAPYGVHLMNTGLYLAAVVVLFKMVRPAYGPVAAIFGSAMLLLIPSLFMWSISALKEPLYFLVAALNLVAAVRIVRAPRLWQRAFAIAVVIASGVALQSFREGGLALAFGGVAGGFLLAALAGRPRLAIATFVLAPVMVLAALQTPQVQARAWNVIHQAAYKHWGHVNTPGLTYRLLDARFYPDRGNIEQMTARDAVKYTGRAVVSYITVPLPWEIESRSALVFLPEQMIWYVMIALLPFGILAGLRRDPLITGLLVAHGAISALLVALSGGNVGTLVRHRGLALPYIVWLSGLGAVTVVAALTARRRVFVWPLVPSTESKAGA